MSLPRPLVEVAVHRALAPLMLLASLAAPAQAQTWKIDTSHSDISFRIRHLVGRVTGQFTRWSGTISGDPAKWANGSVDVSIDVASIDTRNEKRDADLKSEKFFDVAKFPAITFRSSKVEAKGNKLRVTGDFTMHGVTRPVVLEGEYTGSTGSGEQQKLGFTFTTVLNRLDWGVTYNRAVEAGGMLLGDEVTVEINVEAVKG